LLRARPIAVRASTVKGMSVVYDKEGVDPCECDAHITSGVFINDDADLEAGCSTAPGKIIPTRT